jgi:hypothetical protein
MKLSEAVSRTTWPKSIVALISTGVQQSGRMWRVKSRIGRAPPAIAAST